MLVPGVTIANEVVVWGHVNTDYAESPCTYLAELHLTDAAFADFCRLNKLTVDQFHAMLGEDHFANVDWWRVPTDGRKQFDGSSRYASGTIDVREGTRILYHGFQTYGGSTYYFRQGKGPTSLAKL